MIVLFIASLILGLLYGVRVMLFGVERPRALDATDPAERSFRRSPPVIAAFAVAFGVSGYALQRATSLGSGMSFAVAVGLGGAAAALAAQLVRQWWAAVPAHDVDDERYVLQGHLARVTAPIAASVEGEITFEVEGRRHVARARSIDDAAVAADTEVVIERIENDVAYVESWLEVEKRL
jgi:hypothetical protein